MSGDKVLIIGGAIVDVMLTVDALPKTADNIYAEFKKTVVGGCAINIANVLRHYGVLHDLFMPIGVGPYASLIEKTLKDDGYELKIHDNSGDCSYCLCFIEKSKGGERTFISVPGVEKEYKDIWFDNINVKDYKYAFFRNSAMIIRLLIAVTL